MSSELSGKSIADSAVQVTTSYAIDNAQLITSAPVDGEIVRKMGEFWSEVVGADTEWYSANRDLGNGLKFARKDATPYWPSNAHKSSIIDFVQVNVKFKLGKGM